MDEFLVYRLALYTAELSAAIAGFSMWPRIRNTYWRWFPFYLLLIGMLEVAAECIDQLTGNRELNKNLYFFFGLPLQFLFFSWLFYKDSQSYGRQAWAIAGAGIYIVAWIADWLFFADKDYWFSSFSYMVGNIMLLVQVLLYFIRFIKSNELIQYRSVMMFWVATGILIFYLGSLPFYGLYNTLVKEFGVLMTVYWKIQISMACVMYIFFLIAFVWGKPR